MGSLYQQMMLELSIKQNIQILSFRANLVEIFLGCSMKLRVDDKNLKPILSNISRLAQKAAKEHHHLQKIQKESVLLGRRNPENLKRLISNSEKKIEEMEQPMEEVYGAISSSSGLLPDVSFATREECFHVLKYMDGLLENMEELLQWTLDDSMVSSGKKRAIEFLKDNFRFLRKFLELTKNWCPDHEKLKSLHVYSYAMIESTSCLLFLYLHDNKMAAGMIDELKSQVLKSTPFHDDSWEIFIEALDASKSCQQNCSDVLIADHFEDFLDSLLLAIAHIKVNSTESVKPYVNYVHWVLQILKHYFADPSINEWNSDDSRQNLKNLFFHIKVVASEAACIIYSYGKSWAQNQLTRLKLGVSKLYQECNFIKEEAKYLSGKMFPTSMRCNFPQTNQLAFIEFVLQHLKSYKVEQLRYHTRDLCSNIMQLRMMFLEITERPSESEELGDHWKRFVDIVYQTEYVIDSFMIHKRHLWFHKLEVFVLIMEMKDMMKEIDRKRDRSTDGNAVTDNNVSLQLSSNLIPAVNVSDKPSNYMELFEDEVKRIIEQLTNNMKQLNILSIVGMPGIGKTTLANAIYNNHSVQFQFHVCASCCVSQAYQKRRLLLNLLQQVSGRTTDKVHGSDDDDLARKLYQCLKGKRYLILIDDLWDDWQWNDIRASFPDDYKGSRILLTSRFRNITSRVGCKSLTFPLRQLSDAKSWELLQVKLFQTESCPEELLQVGKQIASKCNGLPLALDLVAGILRNIGRKQNCWQQVENSLSKQLLEDQQGRCMDVLELSYNHLPDHLKPCFLYFGAFPEDKEVMTTKLSWLWIAEGFIQLPEDANGTLEDAAEKVLNELIARSLVIVTSVRSDGGIKSSRLHDLLLAFASRKAKEEFFLQAGSSDLDSSKMHVPYRLSANSRWDDLAALSMPQSLRIRTLLLSRFLPSNSLNEASKLFRNMQLLRVLDLGSIELQDFQDDICSITRLRFLSLRYYSNEIPDEINKLSDLETLMLKVTSSSHGFQLPNTFCESTHLRHLKVYPSCKFPKDNTSFKFVNLQTLSKLSICFGEHEILRGLPNLRKLSCIFLNSGDDSSSHCQVFPVLDFLSRLESLKVEWRRGKVQHPCVFKFPRNLKKLTLRSLELPWSEVRTIMELPNLQILKLLHSCFKGDTWDMMEGVFRRLKFLKLQSLDVKHWNVWEDNLPCLETLVVEECNKLEIPHCLGEIPTLQKLELLYCNSSARVSARMIQINQQELGNDQFVLSIKERAAEDPYYPTSDNPEQELHEQENDLS